MKWIGESSIKDSEPMLFIEQGEFFSWNFDSKMRESSSSEISFSGIFRGSGKLCRHVSDSTLDSGKSLWHEKVFLVGSNFSASTVLAIDSDLSIDGSSFTSSSVVAVRLMCLVSLPFMIKLNWFKELRLSLF